MEDDTTPDISQASSVDTPDLDEYTEAKPKSSGRGAGIAVLMGIVVVVVAIIAFALAPKGAPTDGSLPISDPKGYMAPAVDLPQLNGTGNLSLASLKGKPVVVNFWASWCTTCKQEALTVAAAEKKWRDKGVIFVGLDSLDKQDAAKAYEKEYGIGYTSLFDPDGKQAPIWGVTGYPETFFIDKSGRIVSKFISSIDEATMDSSIQAIVS
jgi:cytochrome c biogenesis protein CcmG/thiol:disulfide interchange protein DsbE